jgi:hypothetical protein
LARDEVRRNFNGTNYALLTELGGAGDHIIPLSIDSYAESALITSYPFGVSIMPVSAGANWRGEGVQGTVTIYRTGSIGWQTLALDESFGTWFREIDTTLPGWNPWQKFSTLTLTQVSTAIGAAIASHATSSDHDAQYVNITGDTMTGFLAFGAGDSHNAWVGPPGGYAPQFMRVNVATNASPDLSGNTLGKFVRTMGHTYLERNAITGVSSGDGADELCAFSAGGVGTSRMQVQAVGLHGFAKNSGNSAGASGAPDACAVYGSGRIIDGGTGTGIGAFLSASTMTTDGGANGVELHVNNSSGSHHDFSSSGWAKTHGIWLNCSGANRSAAAIVISNHFNQQFDAGIILHSTNTGAVRSVSFGDYSASERSLFVKGTHLRAAIAVGSGSGPVVLGADDPSYSSGTTRNFPNALIEAYGGSSGAEPLIVLGSLANSQNYSINLRNSSGQSHWTQAGAANGGLTGTAAGDSALRVSSSGKALHLGGTNSVIRVGQDNTLEFRNGATILQTMSSAGLFTYGEGSNLALGTTTGTKIGTGATQKIGFWNAAPVVRPTGWGAPTGVATRTAYATSTASVTQLAERLKGLIDDLTTIGLIGA